MFRKIVIALFRGFAAGLASPTIASAPLGGGGHEGGRWIFTGVGGGFH